MPNIVRLNVERLEDRLTPTSTGIAWPDPTHLTLSFAPDGSDIGGTPSNLFGLLNARAPRALWQREILRAVQTWADQANLDVSVVPDSGQPFGVTGAIEGDTRFGDIRVGAKPLPGGTLATGTPFDWSASTWAGDIVLNSNNQFGIGGSGQYDLFTVVAHEAGHAFGIEDTKAGTSSLMYASYNGAKSTPSAADLGDLQSLYSARAPDAYDSVSPNNTRASASKLSGLVSSCLTADADITTLSDVDYFKFSVPLTALPFAAFAVTVQTSHISSLEPSLTIYDAAGNTLSSAAATDPTHGDLTLQVNNLLPLSTYYVRVGPNSSDAFGIGAYHLSIQFSTLTSPITPILEAPFIFVNDLHTNDFIQQATGLSLRWGNASDARFQYVYTASVSDPSDVDYYRIRSPQTATGAAEAMVAMVWAMDAANPLEPRINVFDASGQPVAIQILANGGGAYTVQVAAAAADSNYYLKISPLNPAGPNNTGNYFLGVNFHTGTGEVPATVGWNTLAGANASDAGSIQVNQSELFNFALSATNGGAATESLTMTVTDASGRVVATLTATTGQPPVTLAVYLGAGTYGVRYKLNGASRSSAPVNYWLQDAVLSDPLGAYSTGNSGGSSAPAYTYNGSSTSNSNHPSQPYYY